MGNTQSTTEGPRSGRLHAPTNLRATASSVDPACADSASPSPSTWNETARTDSSLVASATNEWRPGDGFRQLDHAQGPQTDQPDGRGWRNSQLDTLAASVARTLSRSGSRRKNMLTARSSSSRLHGSSQLSPASENTVDLESALAIIHELRKTASPEDLAALHKALQPVPSRDSLAPTAPSESPGDIDPATAALIRRKSFAQPGVATRHAKSDRNVLRKSVPAPTSNPRPWTKDMMGASPLARLSSLDVPSLDDLEPPPEVFVSRAHTPSDLDYSQLGNLKHGSLMVVNGPPSPNPSVATRGYARRMASDEHEEAFFTASERDDSRPSSRRIPNAPAESYARKDIPLEEELMHGRGQMLDYAPPRRDGSPSTKELRQPSPETNRDADLESVYSRNIRPVRSMASLHSDRTGRFSFEDLSVDEAHQSSSTRLAQSAVSLATEYMSEMPPSPYKTSAMEENGASAAPAYESDGEVRAPSIREQIVTIPPSMPQNIPPISPRKPLRSNPTLEEAPTQTKRPNELKTDSGYSSASTSVVDSMSPIKMHHSNLSTVESLAERPQQRRFYSSRGTADLATRIGQIGSPNDLRDPDAEPGVVESIEKDEAHVETMKRTKSWRKSVRRSLPRLLSSESTNTTASKTTSASTASSTERKAKKLQKPRPLSQPPITVGDRHILNKDIPRIPSSVFSRYSCRLSASPGLQHLEQTFDNAPDSDDGLFESTTSKTILPSCFFPDAGLEDGSAQSTHRLSFKRGSFRRSRTQTEELEIPPTGIADLGTVSQSLGTSPYDVAYIGPGRSISRGATQPHHLSTKTPRSGPREGWDLETASKIAQFRSRDRVAQQHTFDQQWHSGKDSMPSRPKSYHEHMPTMSAPRPHNTPIKRPKSMHAQEASDSLSSVNNVMNERTVPNLPVLPPHQPRPRTSHSTRDSSPVKKLVNVFEQRASEAPAPPPMPSSQPDWSDSSRIWRQRRLDAQAGTVTYTSSSPSQGKTGSSTTTTTTTVSSFSSRDPRTMTTTTTTTTVGGARPSMQSRKSMPQIRRGTSEPQNEAERFDRFSGGRAQHSESNHFAPIVKKRIITPTSAAMRPIHGIDFGNVATRVL
ncbi:uncharacterized protein PV09_06954 [Verruconis gallopava]|uniref:Uncharacterized protein n=1 Tax=Verruconis gallopava TaxID=253628 RepID=A0A0D1YLR8_9PEZI|nr:uncharacterized protein PV09_06954 [Verruconis gallopava]KIW01782.1 hypothetical protein PV09_06954 [Verruconis gallopava]